VLHPIYNTRFKKDIALAKKRGKDLDKLKTIIELLLDEQPLPPKLKDHKLSNNYKDRRECHIEPDWLLIYKPHEKSIIFERTGTHSDLFK
jgi:mRNA interferase YafQ